MEMQTIIYLAVTILTVIFAVGTFVGINNMSFKAITEKLESMGEQIKEVRDDQKSINELNTRMALVENGLMHMEKCHENLQTDITIIKKRQSRKVEE